MKRGTFFVGAVAIAFAACTPTPEEPEATSEGFEDGPPLVTVDGKGDELAADLPAYAPLAAGADLDVDFEALFAPDDPVNTVEMAYIERVTDARRADTRSFEEGENPYRIRYAVYNLRNPRIVEALADAHDAGVDVQVLIDAKQLDPARDWNVADERLIERGFEFHADHRELQGDETITADLVGIAESGLMHMKARLFETPADRVLLSGSLNPGDHAVMNEETLHVIRNPDIVARYVRAYESVLHDEPLVNEWDEGAAINVLFTPSASDRAVEHLFDWLAEEHEQILLMVFSLRNLTAPNHSRDLVELLGDKVRSGVPVAVITDRKQSDGVDAAGNRMTSNDTTEDRLRSVGVRVYEATNLASPFTAMHHKAAILGRTRIRVITDAANWTFSGLGSSTRRARNIESQLFIDSARLDDNRTGRRYLAQWMRVASRYAAQSSDDGEAPFGELSRSLTEVSDWPTEEVSFTVDDAHTQFGQSVFVRGELAELGDWGALSEGHELTTDEASYPTWHSPAPIPLAVGSQFEWKLVVKFPGEDPADWEPGPNRFGHAQPTVLQPAVGANHRGKWQ